MEPLAVNLAIIFGSRLITGNFLELLLPYLSYQFKYNAELVTRGGKMSRPEREHLLDPYDSRKSSLIDYAEVAIQFGYNAIFATALPASAAFALISNVVEIKGDAWKLLKLYQRPIPASAEDIGMWQTIFLLISIAAVITNAGITVFTMDVLDIYPDNIRFWIFIAFQWTCFLFQVCFDMFA